MSQIYLHANNSRMSDSESEDEADDKNKDFMLKLPKVLILKPKSVHKFVYILGSIILLNIIGDNCIRWVFLNCFATCNHIFKKIIF